MQSALLEPRHAPEVGRIRIEFPMGSMGILQERETGYRLVPKTTTDVKTEAETKLKIKAKAKTVLMPLR